MNTSVDKVDNRKKRRRFRKQRFIFVKLKPRVAEEEIVHLQ